MINTIIPVVNKFSLEIKLTSLFGFCSSEFSLLLSEDSVKEPIHKYINAAKVVLQYIDSVFLSTETGAEMLRTI